MVKFQVCTTRVKTFIKKIFAPEALWGLMAPSKNFIGQNKPSMSICLKKTFKNTSTQSKMNHI